MDFTQPVTAVQFPRQTQAHLIIYFSFRCVIIRIVTAVLDGPLWTASWKNLKQALRVEHLLLCSQHNLVGPLCTSSCPTQLHFSNKFPIYTFRLLQALFGHLCPLLLGHDRLFISSSLACFLAFQLCFSCLTIRLLSQLQINSIKHIGQAARK